MLQVVVRFKGPRGGAVGWGTALQAGKARVRFPMVSLELLIDRTVALLSTQPLTEMSTRNIYWGIKVAGAYGWQTYHLRVSSVLKSRSLNLLEPEGRIQACNGIVLPLYSDSNRTRNLQLNILEQISRKKKLLLKTETSDINWSSSESVEFKYVFKASHLLSCEMIILFITSYRQAEGPTQRPS